MRRLRWLDIDIARLGSLFDVCRYGHVFLTSIFLQKLCQTFGLFFALGFLDLLLNDLDLTRHPDNIHFFALALKSLGLILTHEECFHLHEFGRITRELYPIVAFEILS